MPKLDRVFFREGEMILQMTAYLFDLYHFI